MEFTLKTPAAYAPGDNIYYPASVASMHGRDGMQTDFVENLSPKKHLTPAETFYHHEYEIGELLIRSYVMTAADDDVDDDDADVDDEDLDDDDVDDDDFEEDVDEIEEDIDDLDLDEDDDDDDDVEDEIV